MNNTEFAEIEISHRTRCLQMHIIFPKSRPPPHPVRIQQLKRIGRLLAQEHIRELPDGR
jgi:hypothetical protein